MLTRRRLVCAFLLLVALGLGTEFWLRSGPLRGSALKEILRYYAGAVELDRVTIRPGLGLILRGVRFHATSDSNSPVIGDIPEIVLQGSVWDMLRGEFQPKFITASRPKIRLIQSAAGEWKFNPPVRSPAGSVPSNVVPIQVSDAILEFLSNDGSTSRTVDHIDVRVRSVHDSKELAILGMVTDSVWGKWTADGTVDTDSGEVRTRWRCDALPVRPELADWFGADASSYWRTIEVSGNIAVDASLALNLDGNSPLRYQVLVDPQQCTVRVAPLPGAVQDVAGRVEITPNNLRIHGLAGDLAGGQLIVSGTVSPLSPTPVSLAIELKSVVIDRVLPAKSAATELQSIVAASDTISGKLQIEGPLDPAEWSGEFVGSLALHESDATRSVPLQLNLTEGSLWVEGLEWAGDAGRFVVSARVPVHGEGEIEGAVRFTDADLRSLNGISAPGATSLLGNADGNLTFRVPIRLCGDRMAWEWSGPVQSMNLQVGDLAFDSIAGTLVGKGGRVTLRDGSAVVRGRRLFGKVDLSLAEPHDLTVQFRLMPLELADLAPERVSGNSLSGRLEATGTISGRLESDSVKIRGDGIVRRLRCGPLECGDARFQYDWTENVLRLTGLDVTTLGGRFRGSCDWWPGVEGTRPDAGRTASHTPRRATSRSHFRATGSFDAVDSRQLLDAFGVRDTSIQGPISGELKLEFDPAAERLLDTLRGSGHASSRRLAAGSVPIVGAAAEFEINGPTIAVRSLAGTLPAGDVTGTARIDLSDADRSLTAELQSPNLELAKLAPQAARDAAVPVAGTTDVKLSIRYDLATGDVTGRGAGRIRSFRVADLPRIDSVTVPAFELRNGMLSLTEFQANLWSGTASGSCDVNLVPGAGKLADVTLTRVDRIELSQMTANWLAASGRPRGRASGTGRLVLAGASPQPAVLGTGEFTVESAVFANLALGKTVGSIEAFDAATHEIAGGKIQLRRSPTGTAAQQRVLIRVREARPARGNLQGTALLGVNGNNISYDTSLRFSGLDLATVTQTMFASRNPVSGVLSGEMRLVGNDRGPEDAHGEMWFRVDNGNLWRFPVLAVFVRESSRTLNRLLNLNLAEQGPQTAVARRVTLDRGVLHVQEFWIAGDVGRLFGEGKVGLDGRIDLDFVGNFDTGLSKNVPVLSQLNSAFKVLQQRLIKFHITGTLNDPVAVPVPLQDLTEPAERFFRGIITGTLFDDPDRNPRPMLR
jgi:hypothetical protein